MPKLPMHMSRKFFKMDVGLDTAVDVFADVVEGFQIEVAGFQFRLNAFGFYLAGIEFRGLVVAGIILSNHPL